MQSPNKTYPLHENFLSYVEMYASAGYGTFPCKDKTPAGSFDWRQSPVDALISLERYPSCQFGVVLKDDDLIVDLDPRNMEGKQVWTQFKEDFKIPKYIQDTFCVKTGSGGFHIYLKKPRDWKIRKNLPAYKGIDFLTKGCYIIGAGSNHESGQFYVPLGDAKHIVAKDAPHQLLEALHKPDVLKQEVEGEIGFDDSEENCSRFIEFIERSPGAQEGDRGDVTTFKVACRGRDNNLTMQKAYEIMRDYYNPKCFPQWSESDLKQKVKNAYSYSTSTPGVLDPKVILPDLGEPEVKDHASDLFERTSSLTVKTTLNNAVIAINHTPGLFGLFKYNLFTDRVELAGDTPWERQRVNVSREIDDSELCQLMYYMGRTYRADFSKAKIQDAVLVAAQNFSYHPIRDYVTSLEWDGESRLDDWLMRYCGAEYNNLNRSVGRKLLVAMVSRIFNPGVKFDYVTIFEGAQGIGKSTICSILGGKWFGEMPIDVKNKDTVEYVHSHWVVELAEMTSIKKTDVSSLKAFISRQVDEMRPAYARMIRAFPRQCVFIGTINPDGFGYLPDSTGNRRYWPVHLGNKILIEELRAVKDQLIAEAYNVYKQGSERLYLDEATTAEALDIVSTRQSQDSWFEPILEWVQANPDVQEIKAKDIYENVLFGRSADMHTGISRRIAACLQQCGFVRNFKPEMGNYYERVSDNNRMVYVPSSVDAANPHDMDV